MRLIGGNISLWLHYCDASDTGCFDAAYHKDLTLHKKHYRVDCAQSCADAFDYRRIFDLCSPAYYNLNRALELDDHLHSMRSNPPPGLDHHQVNRRISDLRHERNEAWRTAQSFFVSLETRVGSAITSVCGSNLIQMPDSVYAMAHYTSLFYVFSRGLAEQAKESMDRIRRYLENTDRCLDERWWSGELLTNPRTVSKTCHNFFSNGGAAAALVA